MGVDIGGTFTDIVVGMPDGTLAVSKVSSTPRDPGAAVVQGLGALLHARGVSPAAVGEIVHGTTVASNAILQKRGARVGLVTTRGFRDVLEIGRVRMPDLFDLTWEKPAPLVERRLRVEVDERIAADGGIVRPLDRDGVEAAAARLVAAGVEAVAICFINSYVNPAHEVEAECLLRARYPSLPISASYRVLPEIKEYERTSTTVVNAYLLPTMRGYLDDLSAGLRGIGIEAPLLVVASNGGVMGAVAVAERPAFAVGSGPAAGVSGAARLGQAMGEANLIVFDMGGTTAKASLHVIAPEGTILNPRLPGACAARALTGYRMLDVMLGALAQALPERVPAAGEGGNTVLSIGGLGADRKPFVIVDMITGAWGGRPDKDGMEAVTNPSQNISNTPVEVLEAQHPIRIDEYGFVPDSAGAGRWRGGLGLRRRNTLLNDEATLQLRSDRMRFAPYGLAGGRPARGTRNVLNPDTDARAMPAKFAVTLRRGDAILHEQPGGGGFGDPLAREPARVAADVANEKITVEYARREHGVVIDAETLAVDADATAALRRARGAGSQGAGVSREPDARNRAG